MKKLFAFYFTLITVFSFSQSKQTPTDEFSIVGMVPKELTFNMASIEKMPATKIGDLVITNHLGEKKGTATNLSGIPIKTFFKDIDLKVESPKQMSEFFFVFVASDNYKVVYSWNEIFNTSTGDNTFLVVEKDGKKLGEMEDRLLIVTKTDYKTGRRFIKSLSKIIVQRVQ